MLSNKIRLNHDDVQDIVSLAAQACAAYASFQNEVDTITTRLCTSADGRAMREEILNAALRNAPAPAVIGMIDNARRFYEENSRRLEKQRNATRQCRARAAGRNPLDFGQGDGDASYPARRKRGAETPAAEIARLAAEERAWAEREAAALARAQAATTELHVPDLTGHESAKDTLEF